MRLETHNFNSKDPLVDIVCDQNIAVLQMEQVIGNSDKVMQMLLNDEHELQSQVSEISRQIIATNYNMQ